MLARGAVFAVVVALLLALPVRELSAARHPSGWGQRFKSFFELREAGSLDMLKQLGVGTALAATIWYSALFSGQAMHDFISNKYAVQSDVMLDTIIRFDDDIIGRTFHYTADGRHYQGEAVEWQAPYNKMRLYSIYSDAYIHVPVENLLGKAVVWHEHQYANVVFIDPDRDSYLLHGEVLTFFDSDYYYVIAEAQEDRDGNVTPLDERRLVFVPQKFITALEPLPSY